MALQIAFVVFCVGMGFVGAGIVFGLVLALLDRRWGAVVIVGLALLLMAVVVCVLAPDALLFIRARRFA